ncbi:MAG TPA: DUF1592 domain-containing protein [Polyangiaceae bacterium]|nr:DUF1592 domain-containing protein [Polyangiaceae bacterium]
MRTALLLLGLGIAGCTAEITGPSGATGGPPGTTTPGGVAGSGGATTTPGGQPLSEGPSPRLIRQLTLSEYNKTVADLLYLKDPDTTRVPPDVSLKGFTTNVAAAFVSETHLDAYVAVGMSLAERAVQESFSKLVPCATADDACAAQFVDSFGLRAFRRPLSVEEKARYVALFQPSLTGGDFKQGVSLVISAMLASPNFLFRSELGEDLGGGHFKLTPYETAAALSYTYWGTMPDDALLASASRGDLAQPAELEAQVRRLLADARGKAHIGDFFFEWTESARAYVASKDLGVYADRFKSDADVDAIVTAMKAEEDAFVNHVVFDSTKKFAELFTADYTFANDRLAAYYGLPAPGTGDAPAKVTIDAGSARGGLLTLGMFLFGHARTDQSSPVQRGHLIRSNIFCSEVPPPPPGVDATVKPGTPGKTGRAQIEALTGSGQCPACHGLLNPVGFALEAFGSAAEERATDNGEVVDTSGQLKNVPGLADAVAFTGVKELSNIIATSTQAQACLASSYHRYARGFAATGDDLGAVQRLSDEFVKEGLDLPELFVRVALQDSFTSRRSVEVLQQ